jgi:hypothetical protein
MSPRIILHPAIVVAIVGLLAPTTCFCRPIITQEPKSQTNVVGGTVTFVVEASGTAPLSYQWSFNSVGNPLPGATNAISVITNVQASHVGAYRVVVTNAEGSVTSRVASLEIESTFTKITTGPVVTDLGLSWGVTWADYDNDGLLDLDISNNDGPNFLYRNAGNGNFTRITTGPVGTELNGLSKTWGDFDNDGDLDVFTPGIRGMLHRIYRNNGDGSFTLLSANEVGSVALNGGNGREVSLGDYDNDGYLDLFIASGLGFANELYHGSVGGQFEKITTGPIPQDGDDSIQGGWSDYDDDGDLDLLVAAHGSKFFYQTRGCFGRRYS